jgi:septum formation protein
MPEIPIMPAMLYLASASPRRQELLRQVGIPFETLPSGIEETRQPGESPLEYVRRVAADKARQVYRQVVEQRLPRYPVLGADTEVVMEGDILGKPRDRAHATAMLRRLSGNSHTVLTAISVVTVAGEFDAVSKSRVTFAAIPEAALYDYVQTGEADDKAGAYAIQGRAALFIARLEGSFSGVMGLPLYELSETLKRAGIEP